MDSITKRIQDCVISGDDEILISLITEALASGLSPKEVMDDGLTSAMDIVGPKMESGELFISEVLMCSDTMKIGIDYIKPMLEDEEKIPLGKVVIGTVHGDLHDIGKNIVAMMLEISGFEVIDIGIDKPVEAFVTACRNQKPDIICLSALLTTTMVSMKNTVEALKEFDSSVKVIVGGAPVSRDFAEKINADGYSDDAGGAIAVCKNLMMVEA